MRRRVNDHRLLLLPVLCWFTSRETALVKPHRHYVNQSCIHSVCRTDTTTWSKTWKLFVSPALGQYSEPTPLIESNPHSWFVQANVFKDCTVAREQYLTAKNTLEQDPSACASHVRQKNNKMCVLYQRTASLCISLSLGLHLRSHSKDPMQLPLSSTYFYRTKVLVAVHSNTHHSGT